MTAKARGLGMVFAIGMSAGAGYMAGRWDEQVRNRGQLARGGALLREAASMLEECAARLPNDTVGRPEKWK